MPRPSCVVSARDLPGEKRPRRLIADGVASLVWEFGASTGLTRMGVSQRAVEPGLAGTNRHFHEVEEEWVYVLSGNGRVRIGALDLPVRVGSFVGFPPGPRPHCFVAGSERLVYLEGGERRKGEETVWYPDAGLRFKDGKLGPGDGPASEAGDSRQAVHIDDVRVFDFEHPVDARSRRVMRSLHTATGLSRQAVRWSRVVKGGPSTVYHSHDRTDEWVFILEGRARARVGGDRFGVEAGDFLGHPAGGPAHVMEPETDLVYLMGGMIDPEDVVTYPEAGKRKVGDVITDL